MKELTVLTNNNERVLTTKQLADVYETEISNIKKNLSVNKSRFVEGKHYYKLTGDELKEFKNLVTDSNLVDKRTPSLILWTEKGANRMCKILDTDKAWEQFEVLEETYFNVKVSQRALLLEKVYEGGMDGIEASRLLAELEKKPLIEKIECDKPFVELAKERIAKGDKISITDITKTLGLKRGQLTTYLKTNGYLHKTQIEVNKKGEGMFGVYRVGNFRCIGILEKGIDFINDNLEEIKKSKTRMC